MCVCFLSRFIHLSAQSKHTIMKQHFRTLHLSRQYKKAREKWGSVKDEYEKDNIQEWESDSEWAQERERYQLCK